MTQREAMNEQKMLEIKGMDIGWYFGVRCEKCCGVFPRFRKKDTNDKFRDTYYQCDVCGKQTGYYGMPKQAEDAWNNHQFLGAGVQMNMFMEGA